MSLDQTSGSFGWVSFQASNLARTTLLDSVLISLFVFIKMNMEPWILKPKHADQLTHAQESQNGSENLSKYRTLIKPAPTVPGAGELPR
jgi:hypothetical protein